MTRQKNNIEDTLLYILAGAAVIMTVKLISLAAEPPETSFKGMSLDEVRRSNKMTEEEKERRKQIIKQEDEEDAKYMKKIVK